MSPLTKDQQHHLAPKAEGAEAVNLTMMCLGSAEAALRDAEREVRYALLDAMLYCGCTTTDLAAVTGWSRRTVRRKLHEVSDDLSADDLR